MKGLAQNLPGNRSSTNGGCYSYCYSCCYYYWERPWVCSGPSTVLGFASHLPHPSPPGPWIRILWRGKVEAACVDPFGTLRSSQPGLRGGLPCGARSPQPPLSASQVSPPGSGQNPARLRQGAPDAWEGRSPGLCGRGKGWRPTGPQLPPPSGRVTGVCPACDG